MPLVVHEPHQNSVGD